MANALDDVASQGSASSEECPRSGPSNRHAYKAFRSISTRWMDNDVYAHVNNVAYYGFFDTAVNGWLMEQGLLDPSSGDQIGLVVETGCRYFAPLAFPDQVNVGLRTSHIGRSSVRFELGVFCNDEAVASAEGFFVHVYVNRLTRRPEPLAGSLRHAVEAIAGDG